jgi:hypothetical protein
MKKITKILAILCVLLILIGVEYAVKQFVNYGPNPNPIVSNNKESICLSGESEHLYDGKIKDDKNIKIVLSCDLKKMTITGAVNQEILGDTALADIISGDRVIDTDGDFNFDGYNDISSIVSNGQGRYAIDYYNIYLYQPKDNKFVLSQQLGDLANIHIDNSKKEVVGELGTGGGGNVVVETIRYKWNVDNFVKVTDLSLSPKKGVDFVISENTFSVKKDGKVLQTVFLSEDAVVAATAVNSNNFQKFITNQDANFDGYNDLAVFAATGYNGVNNFYDYYIFNTSTNKFDKNSILVNISNPSVDSVAKEVISSYRSGPQWYQQTFKFNGSGYSKSAESLTTGM